MGTYVYDQASDLRRLVALQDWLDPKTTERLERLGVGSGWRCLEVGGGAGSIASWLAARVGPRGQVVATDVDTRYLEGLDGRIEVRRHDVTVEPLEEGGFDLVHARAVLAHLPARDSVLLRLVAALRPGGWLVVEDVDFQLPISTSASAGMVLPADASPLMARTVAAMATVMRFAGVDPEYGRLLPARLIQAGLVDVAAVSESELVWGASTAAKVFAGTLEQLWEPLLDTGAVDEADLERLLALFDRPDFVCMSPALVTAWGRRSVQTVLRDDYQTATSPP